MDFKALWRSLTDFSEAEKDQQEVESVLREALAYQNGDGDFEATLRLVLNRRFGQEGGYDRYLGIMQILGKFRRSYTDGADLRTVAEQVLKDLPEIYGKRSATER